MSPTTLKRLTLSAPPPKIVLLPDTHFFVRAVPIDTAQETSNVAQQVELAMESLAPFPLEHMFYGYFWREGAKHALVYAAYRKRFTSEQTDAWSHAEGIIPTFATLLGMKVERPTTFVLAASEGVTALHWTDPADVPSRVLSRHWNPDTPEDQQALIYDEVIRELGGTRSVVDVTIAPSIDPESSTSEIIFHAGPQTATYSTEELDALDIRDKVDLAARRRARFRDLIFWRTFIGCLIAMACALVLEGVLLGGKAWQSKRLDQVARQSKPVAEILTEQTLANRIEELSTKRLLPFEMIEAVWAKTPNSITYTQTLARDIYTLQIDAETPVPTDLGQFRTALEAMPIFEKIDFPLAEQRIQQGKQSFRVILTFKPAALKPGLPSL